MEIQIELLKGSLTLDTESLWIRAYCLARQIISKLAGSFTFLPSNKLQAVEKTSTIGRKKKTTLSNIQFYALFHFINGKHEIKRKKIRQTLNGFVQEKFFRIQFQNFTTEDLLCSTYDMSNSNLFYGGSKMRKFISEYKSSEA